MSRQEKLLAKIRNNPKGVRFEELDLLLTWHGFERRQSKRGTSHYVYRRGHHVITIARHKPVLPGPQGRARHRGPGQGCGVVGYRGAVEMEKTVDYYMNLPYTIELQRDPEEGWFVRVKELRGCMSQGDTVEEAVAMVQDAMLAWLEIALEDGLPIPEPHLEEDYSGKFVVRVPRSLHRDLVENARREGVSLNQYINVVLARAINQPAAFSRPAAEEPGWPVKSPVKVLATVDLTQEAGELDKGIERS